MGRIDYETETMIACTYAVRTAQTGANGIGVARDVSHTLDLASGQAVCVIPFDTTQVSSPHNYSNPKAGDPCHPLAAGAHPPTIAFNSNAQPDEMRFDEHVSAPLTCSQYSAIAIGCDTYNGSLTGDVAATLGTQSGDGLSSGSSSGSSVLQPGAVAFQSSQSGVRLSDVHATLDSNNGPRRHNGVLVGMHVRRLLPTECETLQGFPRGYTAVPDVRGKPSADGPRYKALGNSMAVPVMRWIGQQIDYAMIWSTP